MTTHRLRRAAHAFVLVPAALWALGACAVTQELLVRADRSGETAIAIDLAPDVVDRMKEMAALTGRELPEDGLVDLEKLHKTLSTLRGVTVTQLEAPEDHRLEIAFAFEDAPAMFPSPSLVWEAGIVTFEEVEEGTRLRLYLDLDSYKQIKAVFPEVLDDDVIRAMGPEENTEITAEDYLTMMGFVLGPSGPDAISESVITIRLNVASELVSQRGGRIEDGVAIFELNLLDLLLLHEPVDLEVVFR
ncbi:MAG: hypothetical protein OXJ90_24825 [Spirochaetaceae bacterium]|nr:hypothetical protein [Spirochaetaceae bacterium]